MFVYRSGFIVSLFVFPIWLYSFFVEVSLASLLLPIKAIFRNFQFRLFWVMHWNWELEMFFCVYFPFERMRILLSKHCIVFKWDHICLWVLPAMGCFLCSVVFAWNGLSVMHASSCHFCFVLDECFLHLIWSHVPVSNIIFQFFFLICWFSYMIDLILWLHCWCAWCVGFFIRVIKALDILIDHLYLKKKCWM